MFFIRGRKSWRALPARGVLVQDPASIHTLVVHHTAGRAPIRIAEAREEMRAIQSIHMNTNGWDDIGYNFVIDRAGRVWEGRGYDRVGAHTRGYNTGTIGVSFMGNYETIKPTRRQLAAFRLLKRRLAHKNIKPTRILGHKQMPNQATACPGKNLMEALGL